MKKQSPPTASETIPTIGGRGIVFFSLTVSLKKPTSTTSLGTKKLTPW
jgi:hypothetical protein